MRLFRLLLPALLPAVCLAGPADLDPAFGTLGKKLGEYRVSPTTRYLPMRAFAATGAGYAGLIAREVPPSDVDVFLVRFDAQGNEIGAVDLGVSSLALGAAHIAADGSVVMAHTHYLGNDEFELRLERRRADGTPDPAFGGGDGIVGFTRAGLLLSPSAMHVFANGQAVAAGYAGAPNADPNLRQTFVVRVDSAGTPIPGFGTGGVAIVDLIPGQAENPAAVALLGTGQILVCDRGEFGGQSDALLSRLTNTGVLDTYASGGTLYYDSTLPAGNNQDDRCIDIDVNPLDGTTVMTVGRSEPGVDEGVRRVPVDAAGNAGPAFDHMVARFVRDAALAFDAQGRSVLLALSKRPGAADFDLVRFTAAGAPDASFGLGGAVRHSVALPVGVDPDAIDLGIARLAYDSRGRILAAGSLREEAADESGWEVMRLQGDMVFADGFE